MKESNSMNKHAEAISDDLGALAEDALALIAAAADVTGEKVSEARKRLAAALENGKEIYGRVRDKALKGARATDQAAREHPYQVMGIAFVAGALMGLLVTRMCSRDRN